MSKENELKKLIDKISAQEKTDKIKEFSAQIKQDKDLLKQAKKDSNKKIDLLKQAKEDSNETIEEVSDESVVSLANKVSKLEVEVEHVKQFPFFIKIFTGAVVGVFLFIFGMFYYFNSLVNTELKRSIDKVESNCDKRFNELDSRWNDSFEYKFKKK